MLALVLALVSTGLVRGDAVESAAWLQIYDRTAQRVVFSRPVQAGDLVELRHTHSVHRRPVEEVFSVTASEGLAMQEMRFDAHGANLPSGPERIGGITTTFLREESGYRVLHHGRPLGSVRMRVGTADVDHVLSVAGEEVRLLDVARQGASVELYVQGRSGERTGK